MSDETQLQIQWSRATHVQLLRQNSDKSFTVQFGQPNNQLSGEARVPYSRFMYYKALSDKPLRFAEGFTHVVLRWRYLVACHSPQEYERVASLLVAFPGSVIEMNNYNGTSDFIIECTAQDAQLLRTHGVQLVEDRVLELTMPLKRKEGEK